MFKYSKAIIFITLVGFSACCCAAGSIPDSFEVDYSLFTKGTRIAKVRRVLSRLENNQYLYRSETRTTGLISLFRKDHIIEESIWKFDGDQIQPLLYSYVRTGGHKDRDVKVHFDWQSKKVTNSIDGSSWQMPAEQDILDKLLYQYAIMRDLETGKNPLSYMIADGGKPKLYNFEMTGEETVKTPLGKFQALKLVRLRSDNRKTTFWCAPSLYNLPVKLEQVEKDGRITIALISSYTGLDL